MKPKLTRLIFEDGHWNVNEVFEQIEQVTFGSPAQHEAVITRKTVFAQALRDENFVGLSRGDFFFVGIY
ncbi:MAG: hypothetical protein ACC645_02835 [Pirellulales bacterium]